MRCLQRATGLCVTCRPLTVEHSKMLLKCYCTPLYGIRPQYENHIVMLYDYNTTQIFICQYLFSLYANFCFQKKTYKFQMKPIRLHTYKTLSSCIIDWQMEILRSHTARIIECKGNPPVFQGSIIFPFDLTCQIRN